MSQKCPEYPVLVQVEEDGKQQCCFRPDDGCQGCQAGEPRQPNPTVLPKPAAN